MVLANGITIVKTLYYRSQGAKSDSFGRKCKLDLSFFYMSNLDLVPMNFKDNCKWVASGFAFEAPANPIKISSTTFTCKLDRFEANEKIIQL